MKTTQFRDFIILQRGFDLPKYNRDEGEYPVIAATGIHGSHSEFKVNPPGVVTGRSGSLGEVVFVKRPYWPLNTTLWVKDFKGNKPRYVYYFLKTLDLKRFNSGAGVPTLNRNHLDTLVVKIHDRQNQQKVASILSAYDDLIENNLRRIKILEEMVQTLYREWFVKFRFPGHQKVKMVNSPLGKIPEGWEVAKLCDVVECRRDTVDSGDHLSDRHYVPIDCLPRKSFTLLEDNPWQEAQSSLQTFECDDILFGAMRPYFHKVVIAPLKGVTRSTCFVLRPYRTDDISFALMTVFQEESVKFANAHSRGTTIPYAVWDGSMAEMPVILPPPSQRQRFHLMVRPMINFIQSTFFKQRNLRQTRDLLLPKLISGELDVSELNITIPEANA